MQIFLMYSKAAGELVNRKYRYRASMKKQEKVASRVKCRKAAMAMQPWCQGSRCWVIRKVRLRQNTATKRWVNTMVDLFDFPRLREEESVVCQRNTDMMTS